MKIAYLCYWNVFVPSGVATKIEDQITAWRTLGHDVELFCITPARADERATPSLNGKLFAYRGFPSRVKATLHALHEIRLWNPDVVYFRYDWLIPPPLTTLRRFPTVAEVNGTILTSYGAGDNSAMLDRLRYTVATAYAVWVEKLITKRLDGLIAPDNALLVSVDPLPPRTAVIPNSIDEPDGPPLRTPTERPAFIYLSGTNTPGQGIDKLAALAEAMPDWDIHLVGLDEDPFADEMPANIIKHPLLPYEAFRSLMAKSDVGISTLALHRKGMDESTPLKTRMYLAHGLPVLLGYLDTSFADARPWFILQIPNTEGNVATQLPAIREFAERIRGRRVQWGEVADRIGTEALEGKRMQFVAEVVQTVGQRSRVGRFRKRLANVR